MLHNDKGINPTRRYNNCTYICNNKRAPKHIKQILTNIKGKVDTSTVLVENFGTPLATPDRLLRQKIIQTENIGFEPHFRPNGPNRHTQDIPFESNRIYILKCI